MFPVQQDIVSSMSEGMVTYLSNVNKNNCTLLPSFPVLHSQRMVILWTEYRNLNLIATFLWSKIT